MKTRHTSTMNRRTEFRHSESTQEKIEALARTLCPNWKGEGSNESEAIRMAIDRVYELMQLALQETRIGEMECMVREPRFRKLTRDIFEEALRNK